MDKGSPVLKNLLIAFVICLLPLAAARAGSGPPEITISTLQSLAEDGYEEAQFLLGRAYATGEGVQLDEAGAVILKCFSP